MASQRIDRVALIVLDSVGIGALPDAAAYGDEGANTLLHVAERCGGLRLPNLASLGLGNILPFRASPPCPRRWPPGGAWPSWPVARTPSPATGR